MRNIIILLRGRINYDSRVQKEIDTLISLGFKIKLIVWSFDPILYKKEGVEIIDINLSDHNIPHKALFTFLKIIKLWYLSAKIVKQEYFDYLHCNDLDTLGALFFLPKAYYSRIIYDAHELFPERFPINSIRHKIWNYIEKQLIKKVNTIIVPEFNRAKYLKEKYNLRKIPYVINNFPKYQSISSGGLKKELNIPREKIRLCYHGVIGPDREVESIIESLKYLPKNFIIIFFGYSYGHYLDRLNKFIKDKSLTDRVFFYGKVPLKETISTVAQCNIGIALYKNTGINNYYCAPNKVFDYIMAGLQVITNDYPSLRMLSNYKFIRLINHVDPNTIAECVQDLVKVDYVIPDAIKRKLSWESLNHIFKYIYKMKATF
jgi:glycosyltransferase involved in cell wall biosynthesis